MKKLNFNKQANFIETRKSYRNKPTLQKGANFIETRQLYRNKSTL